MTLASSGSINLAGASSSPQRSILAELGATAPISLVGASTRGLTGISSGPITMPTDFYGKSFLSYSLYVPYSSVTEGSSFPVVALTNGVPDGTVLYWTIANGSTTDADFTIPFGSVTIFSGSGQINITPVSDGLAEGAEAFTVQLRTVNTGGSVVATSGSITINDPPAGALDGIPNPCYSFAPYDPGYGGGGSGIEASIYVTFYPDGTWIAAASGGGSGTNATGNWYTPTTSGIGNSYWIRFTRTYDGATGYGYSSSPSTGWLNLFQLREIHVGSDTSIGGVRTAIYTIELSTDSGGSTIVASLVGLEMTVEIS